MTMLRHLLLSVVVATAAAETIDLGEDLVLVRPSTLDSDPPPVTGPVVLDLRYVAAPAEGAAEGWQAVLGPPGPLRVVLHDAAPVEALATLLTRRDANVLTVAPAGAVPAPDIAVPVDANVDRAAYEALAAGADVLTLIRHTLDKRRRDEAALVRARSGATTASAPPPPAPEAASAPPVDLLLRHAVLLARGLEALKR